MVDKIALKKESLSILKDIIIAALVVGIILGSIVVYTANWPPLVVVESKSMMHTEDDSMIGAIDPGDLVLVKDIGSREDIITYAEGAESLSINGRPSDGQPNFQKTIQGKHATHSTYDEPGDVIVYYKNGNTDLTPIIHRAIVWIEYNDTASGSFDIPDLDIYGFIGTLTLNSIGYDEVTISINFDHILDQGFQSTGEPHSGFITLGDHNRGSYDQGWLTENGNLVEPVQPAWIMGKARGEAPWFGAIKLYFGDDGSDPGSGRGAVPPNSWTNMFLTIGLLIGFAISLDVLAFYRDTRRKRKGGEEGTSEGEEEPLPIEDESSSDEGEPILEGAESDPKEAPSTEEPLEQPEESMDADKPTPMDTDDLPSKEQNDNASTTEEEIETGEEFPRP